MRVGIEKTWHHPKPGGIDHALGIVISNRIGRHTDNPAILDSKVAGKRECPGAVEIAAALDDEVISGHGKTPLRILLLWDGYESE